jgi:hypothetical protein
MWRNPFAKPFSSESPVHRWRGSVRQTLKSHRSAARVAWCHCHELPPAVSGCLVLAATLSTAPVKWVLLVRALGATRVKQSPRRPEAERGEWRLIATTNEIKLCLAAPLVK